MSLASTAQLLVELNLAGNFNSGIASAESHLGSLGSATSGAATKIESFAGKLKSGLGNALTTFEGRIKSFAGSVTKYLGIGGALSIGGVIEQSIHKLEDFGLALEKVQTLTGETAKDSGTLILLFERFGLSMDQVGTFAGFAEKTLGKLNETAAKGTKVGKSAELQNLELIKNERVAAGLSTKKIDLLIKEQKARDAVTAAETHAVASGTKLQALDAQFGLQLVDSKGKVVSYSEELRQLADFYDRNHDAAQRAFVASTLLGRGYAALAPILNQGSDAIRRAADEADQLGLGNADTAKKIADFRNSMRDLGVQVNILELQIGMALMPVVQRFADRLTGFVSQHGPEIARFFGDLGTFVETTAGNIYDAGKTVAGFWNTIPKAFRDLLVTGIAGDRIIKFFFGFDPAGAAFGALKNAIVSGMAGGVGKSLAAAGIGKLFVQPVYVTNWEEIAAGGGGPWNNIGHGILDTILFGIKAAILPVAIAYASSGADINDLLNPTQKKTPDQQAALVNRLPSPFGFNPFGTPPLIAGVGDMRQSTIPYSGAESIDQYIRGHGDLTAAIDAADMAIRTNTSGLQANTSGLSRAAQAFRSASETLAERLKHSVLPRSEVNAWLRHAERIAKSSESTDAKISGLEDIKKKLDAGDHHQVYYLDRLLAAERARQAVNVTANVNVNVKGGPTYRVSTTTHASTDPRFTGYLLGGGA